MALALSELIAAILAQPVSLTRLLQPIVIVEELYAPDVQP